jgi:hypothetical protein
MSHFTRRVGLSLLALVVFWLGVAAAAQADRAPLLWEYYNLNPRAAGDVNADNKWDAIGFGDDGTYVATSTGTIFNASSRWSTGFGRGAGAGSWTDFNTYPRTVGDVNGDRKADVIGFGAAGTYVMTSTGSSLCPGSRWIAAFGTDPAAGSWASQNQFPRTVADVSGDGVGDIVGFGNLGVYVSRSISTSFAAMTLWSSQYGYSTTAGSWTSFDQYPRLLGDINGDGKADIVGFGGAGVYASRSTGSAFVAFTQIVLADFCYNKGWTSQTMCPRLLGDVNGDGKADIIGMDSQHNIWVSRSTSSGTSISFAAPVLWSDGSKTLPWWENYEDVPRLAGDFDGDKN